MTGFEFEKQENACTTVGDCELNRYHAKNGLDALVLWHAKTCSSTMDLAWNLISENRLPEWGSVLAETQNCGRGQFQRNWHSPLGNVYGSLRLPRLGPAWDDLAPLILTESMLNILKRLGLTASIKWPNDILINGKKVGGILVESRPDTVIAGMGLNLISAPSYQNLRHQLALPAGCLMEFGVSVKPFDIWIPFVFDLKTRIRKILTDDTPQQFIKRIETSLAFLGDRILLDACDHATSPAIFQGLHHSGAILVQTTQGQKIVCSGSIYPVV